MIIIIDITVQKYKKNNADDLNRRKQRIAVIFDENLY